MQNGQEQQCPTDRRTHRERPVHRRNCGRTTLSLGTKPQKHSNSQNLSFKQTAALLQWQQQRRRQRRQPILFGLEILTCRLDFFAKFLCGAIRSLRRFLGYLLHPRFRHQSAFSLQRPTEPPAHEPHLSICHRHS